MTEGLISVIIPVYNAEKYLGQCLDSILNQTYSNLEVICVNDESKDNSSRVLRDYAAKDRRIRIIDKANAGVAAARNSGLAAAKGQYVLFVDSDDWIDLETCSKAMRTAGETQADVVFWGYVSERGTAKSSKHLFNDDRVFNEQDCRNLLHRRFVGLLGEELAHPELADSLAPVWGKLYKREVITDSGASFTDLTEIGTYEDGLFNLNVFGGVKKAVYLNECLYHYRRNNAASATSKYNPRLFKQWQNLYRIMGEYITADNLTDDYLLALRNRRALGVLGLGLNITSSNSSIWQQIKLVRGVLRDEQYHNALKALDKRYFPIHWKVFYTCAELKCAIGVRILLQAILIIISRGS